MIERDKQNFEEYLQQIVHKWLAVLALLGATLIPIFFILDIFTRPTDLLYRFATYRGITTVLVVVQFLIIRATKPNKFYYLHGYFFSTTVGGMIIALILDLGGFDSSYYAGLILVLIAVNMLLSWRPIHSLLNGLLICALYVIVNLIAGLQFDPRILINNMFFLTSTVVITVSISWVRFNLVKSEFELRAQLIDANHDLDQSRAEVLQARDALWGEMQLAKMIQTALLPEKSEIGFYEVASIMSPTAAVGGDYYDIIETPAGEQWVAIGDVSGHGVDSGLIMMMAQTSVATLVNQKPGFWPSEVLHHVNKVLRENVARMGAERFMSMLLFRLGQDNVVVAGKHTDVLVYRARTNSVQLVETTGSWLAVCEDLGPSLQDLRIPIETGDIVLLYTDGITEAEDPSGEMFGENRLKEILLSHAHLPLKKLGDAIFSRVQAFQQEQKDDISLVLLKNRGYTTYQRKGLEYRESITR